MNRFEEIRAKFLEEAKDRTDSRSIYELRKKYLDRKAGEVNALMKEMRALVQPLLTEGITIQIKG